MLIQTIVLLALADITTFNRTHAYLVVQMNIGQICLLFAINVFQDVEPVFLLHLMIAKHVLMAIFY